MVEVNRSSTETTTGGRGPGASNAGTSASSAANGGADDTRSQSATAARGEEQTGGASNAGTSRSQGATRFTRATDTLGDVAYAARQTTQHFRDRNHETIADYVEQGAQHLEQLAQRLIDRDVAQLLRDARRLAQRQPALFVGTAFAIGLFGARFLKSSPADESGTIEFHNPDPTYGGYGDPGTGFTGTANPDEDAYASTFRRQGSASTQGAPSSSPLDEPRRV